MLRIAARLPKRYFNKVTMDMAATVLDDLKLHYEIPQ